jgi:murein DD-endopeptidase MepM/ murein hydrolase activator NlpD
VARAPETRPIDVAETEKAVDPGSGTPSEPHGTTRSDGSPATNGVPTSNGTTSNGTPPEPPSAEATNAEAKRAEPAPTEPEPTAEGEPQAKPEPKPEPKPAPAPAPKRGAACPVARPRSFIDSWGAARSGGRSHKGTDIMNPMGNKLHAYVDGVIHRQSTSSLGGISLYLWGDDGNEYYYAHLSRYASRVGQRVKAGELVAYNGQTGNARFTAPHLHFEVHPGHGAAVNPYPWVKRACG